METLTVKEEMQALCALWGCTIDSHNLYTEIVAPRGFVFCWNNSRTLIVTLVTPLYYSTQLERLREGIISLEDLEAWWGNDTHG
jgi:hypothetical protein